MQVNEEEVSVKFWELFAAMDNRKTVLYIRILFVCNQQKTLSHLAFI